MKMTLVKILYIYKYISLPFNLLTARSEEDIKYYLKRFYEDKQKTGQLTLIYVFKRNKWTGHIGWTGFQLTDLGPSSAQLGSSKGITAKISFGDIGSPAMPSLHRKLPLPSSLHYTVSNVILISITFIFQFYFSLFLTSYHQHFQNLQENRNSL